MYNVGDKIVYPVYGAGIIDGIEDKEIDGQLQTYYVLIIPVGNLKLMISTAKAADHNVRPIHGKDTLESIFTNAAKSNLAVPDNWNHRYKENMDRIRSGDLDQVAAVYKSLLIREREKGLSTAEKKMMTTTKQIILSEIMLAFDIEKTESEEYLQKIFV